jgi:small redox-active disulfide protein 2
MGIFGLGKKKEDEKVNSNNCGGGLCEPQSNDKASEIKGQGGTIKVLGSGCAKCNELEANVKKALEKLGMNTTIEHVTDFSVIAAYGVMSTPALVVDEKVVSYGKVLKVEEAVKLFQKIY